MGSGFYSTDTSCILHCRLEIGKRAFWRAFRPYILLTVLEFWKVGEEVLVLFISVFSFPFGVCLSSIDFHALLPCGIRT
jgi:hypothetical protein